MKHNKVVVCDHIHQSGIDILAADDALDLVLAYDEPKESLKRFTKDANLVITRSSTPVDKNFLDEAKELKFIVRAGVGVDNVDIEECSKRGIIVMNVPTANTIAAVELTMSHILCGCRNFINANNQLKQERIWKRENWYGTELCGKKVGIIGFGNIGSRVAIRCKAFEAKIIAYDPYISPSKVSQLDMTYTNNLDDILSCDIITIHTPKNKETIKMISTEQIAKMKEGTILINVARGGLYDEDAVLEGLRSGKIAFFGVDVFVKEPATANPLLDFENVSVSPHIGANTKESQTKIATQAAHIASEAIKGISYQNALNMPFKESEIPEEIMPFFELTQRISFLASKLVKGAIQTLSIQVSGDIANYEESIKTYAIVGAMRESVDENINYVNAHFIAKERDLDVQISKDLTNSSPYKNKVGIKITSENDTFAICGTVFENNKSRVINVNGFNVDVMPKGKIIFFKNSDIPGVIGEVGMLLGKHGINISDFRLGRNKEANAMAIIIVDQEIKKDILSELSNLKAALDVRYTEI